MTAEEGFGEDLSPSDEDGEIEEEEESGDGDSSDIEEDGDENQGVGTCPVYVPAVKWIRRGVTKQSATIRKLAISDVSQHFSLDGEDDDGEEATEEEAAPAVTVLDEEDLAAYEVKPSDGVLLVAKINHEFADLQVHIIGEDGDVRIRNDYPLDSMPLALEWIDYDSSSPTSTSNLAAVGGFSHSISLWDLNVVNCMEPKHTLEYKSSSDNGEDFAVIDLSWSPHYRNVLASACSTGSITLWDLAKGVASKELSKMHSKEVQCVEFNKTEGNVLLSGGRGGEICLTDCRKADYIAFGGGRVIRDVDSLAWFDQESFLAGLDDGSVVQFDLRKPKSPVLRFTAHEKSISGIRAVGDRKGLVVCCSDDEYLSGWDVRGGEPRRLFSENVRLHELHCLDLDDSGDCLAIGGRRDFTMLNLSDFDSVKKSFGKGEECPDSVTAPKISRLEGND